MGGNIPYSSIYGLLFVCTFCAGVQFGRRVTSCQVSDPVIKEASGLAVSRAHQGVAYTHNDKGDHSEIFAFNITDCSTVATITINAAHNRDWEDLAYGPCLDDCAVQPCRAGLQPSRYCIYIADIGDHGGDGAANNIYAIREPSVLQNMSVDFAGLIRFNWTEQDAETLMLTPDARLFIVSKVTGGHARMAQIPSCAWNFSSRVDLDMNGTAKLKINSTTNDPQGGDISPDGRSMVLVAEHNIFYYSVSNGEFLQAVENQIPTPVDTYERASHSEGIAWAEDGKSFYVIPEGKNPHLFAYATDWSNDIIVG